MSTTLLEFLHSAIVRKRTENLSIWSALLSLALRNKRRYGGLIVHLGVLMMFLGIIGSSAFSVEKTATMQKGDTIECGAYRLVYDGLTTQQAGERQIDAAHFQVYKNSRLIGAMKAEKHLHPNYQPATEVGIRTTLAEDLYIILANYDLKTQVSTVSVLINPLVLWMWIGGVFMVLGSLLALSPQKARVQ